MSTPRPIIFISAVSKELHTARDLIAKTLHALGYEPRWQDIAPTDAGDLRAVLRKWIDQSDAVLQLVGHCYGFAPDTPDPDPAIGECSYTQYEALYARQQGKTVYYLFTTPDHPTDGCGCQPESEHLHALQEKYRATVKTHGDLRHSTSSLTQTELLVRRLKDELDHLRRRSRQHAALVLGLLIVILLGGIWLRRDLWQQTRTTTQLQAQVTQTDQKLDSVLHRYKQMEQALIKLADAEMNAKQFGEKVTPEQLRQRAYTILENELGIAPGTLARELPAFALELYSRADTTLLMRARAAYALNKFDEAEKLFLESEAQDKKAMENAEKVAAELREKRIVALVGAGQSAEAQIHYPQAMEHYRAAAALTSPQRDFQQWLEIQNALTQLYSLQGRYGEELALAHQVWQVANDSGENTSGAGLTAGMYYANALADNGKAAAAEAEYRAVIAARTRVLGADHPATMGCRMNLANALNSLGKHAEAEREYREVVAFQERVLGVDHLNTMGSRLNLAILLISLGRYAEAERDIRAVLALQERLLGAEHPDTLGSRNNLALALADQGKHAEAEKEYRSALKIQERVLGSEHPATLSTRNNLASALADQGRNAEAEQEHRARIKIEERVLGPEHPETLTSRMNLAISLKKQNKLAEAEQEHRAVLRIRERVLGVEHPGTLQSRSNLALTLDAQGRHAEAEQELRAILRIRERVLGPEHPDTLKSRMKLASVLYDLGRRAEAEQEYRALLQIHERMLGAEHPSVAQTCYSLAICLAAQQKFPESIALMQRAEQVFTKALGPDHRDAKNAKNARQILEAELKKRNTQPQ